MKKTKTKTAARSRRVGLTAQLPEEWVDAVHNTKVPDAKRRRFRTAELTDVEAERIVGSRMDPQHASLNKLLEQGHARKVTMVKRDDEEKPDDRRREVGHIRGEF